MSIPLPIHVVKGQEQGFHLPAADAPPAVGVHGPTPLPFPLHAVKLPGGGRVPVVPTDGTFPFLLTASGFLLRGEVRQTLGTLLLLPVSASLAGLVTRARGFDGATVADQGHGVTLPLGRRAR